MQNQPDNGFQRIEVKDGRTGAWVSRTWLWSAFVGQALDTWPDLNGHGADGIVVLARREATANATSSSAMPGPASS